MVGSMQLGEYTCKIYGGGEIKKIIFWFVDTRRMEISDKVYEKIRAGKLENNYALVAIGISDWNRQLSPWTSDAIFGEDEFAGEGEVLKKWIVKEGIPKVLEHFKLQMKNIELLIGGYSLAGLFALWAYYETGLFQGVASCSGSLWYPGWMEYVKTHTPKEGSRIYLSLGLKEEKTQNKTFSQIGNYTRELYQWYKNTNKVKGVILEWNSGNHFTETEERLAKGFVWLLRN